MHTLKKTANLQFMRPLPRFFPLIIILITLLLPIEKVLAENQTIIDSLSSQLSQSSGSEKLKLYKALIASVRNLDPSKGIDLSKKAVALADTLGNELMKAKLMNEEGVCYRKLSIHERALELHLQSLQIFEKLKDSMGIAFTLANIGMVYHQFGNFEKALDYHFRSLYLKEFLGDEPQMAYSQNAIGMVLADMNDYARALDFYLSAMVIRKRHAQLAELANVYANIGKIMAKLERKTEALDFLNKAREIYSASNNEYGTSLVLNQMGELMFLTGKPTEALVKLKEAEQMALIHGNFAVLHFNYKTQKDVYKTLGQYEKALEVAQLAANYRDSIYTERRNRELTELQVRYETQRLDSENEILMLQLQEQKFNFRFLLFAIVVGLLVAVLILVTLFLYRKRQRAKKLEGLNTLLELRVEERTSELHVSREELQKAFDSLKQSEEKFKGISETVPFGIAVTNQSGKIVFQNKALSEATGMNSDSFDDGSWLKSVFLEDRQMVSDLWKTAHEHRKPMHGLQFRIRSGNNIRWMHLKGGLINTDSGFVGMVMVMENITDSKKAEQDIIKAKNKAEESDRLKSAFLANMSHEIRTPMNAILGFSDLLASDDYSTEEKFEFTEMIRSSGKLLLNLINDIIDISKIEAGELKVQPSVFKLLPLMENMHQTFRQHLDQNGKAQVKLILSQSDITEVEINTDKLRLQQILTNLLSNASKFTEKGQIEFGVIKINEKFEFFVKDTGIGIPETKLDVIFERFRQADDSHTRQYGGTGLGLAITKNLTELLGGKIWVESVEGKGTAFYFTLPADDHFGVNGVEFPDYSHITVLVAEDVETNYQLIHKMLRKSNAKVLHAVNGMVALDMAVNMQPDIILMDIQMPEMDGEETLSRLRRQSYDKPIIAITAFALAGEEKAYLDAGFDSYLSKPLGTTKLYQMLQLFFDKEALTHKN